MADMQQEIEGWLRLRTVSGKFSSGLVGELTDHYVNRTLHVHKVLDEIATLEGALGSRRSNAKRATPFRGVVLFGLQHKHITQPGDIWQNLVNHWTQKDRYQQAVRAVPENQLHHHLVFGGYSARAGNAALGDSPLLTGEWSIIFAEHNRRNYYLTLGMHNDDERIWERCRACSPEFPELSFLKEDRRT